VVATAVGQVALRRAVLEPYPAVDLAVVGVGVTEVENVAARPQGREQVRARQRWRRCLLRDGTRRREEAERESSGTQHDPQRPTLQRPTPHGAFLLGAVTRRRPVAWSLARIDRAARFT
jgi:hypothetical protein